MIQRFFLLLLFKCLSFSYRFQILDLDSTQTSQKNFIFAFFHQNLFATIAGFSDRKNPFAIIVSPSNDGDIVAQILEKLGHQLVRGSSSRKGAQALMGMVRLLNKGYPGAITVDGPRGPLHKVKPGVFQLAKLSQVEIIPVCCYPQQCWTIKKSWDQFRVPKPFTKILCVKGTRIKVDSSDTLSELPNILEERLKALEHHAKDVLQNA
jgi:lysophospholipid acyltransferase (LPLAT)-like uncharacterized protein